MRGSIIRIRSKAKLVGSARAGVAVDRTQREAESLPNPALPPVCRPGPLADAPSALLTVLLLALLFGLLTTGSFASDRSDATRSPGNLWLISAARASGVHPMRGSVSAPLHPLIEQVRFNQTALSFDQGVTIGPDPGDLEIQFASPPSGSSEHLRYRLLGFDPDWTEVGKDRLVQYSHLAPGRYEFDFQQAESGGLRGSLVEGIPIVVVAPYWKTPWFRSLCMVVLVFVVLALHKLRVRYLMRHAQKLQEAVSQTKAELTLAARAAGDAQEALKEQALKDGLTGLWNRRAIFAMLEREVCRAQRDHFPIALVMIDLDHFKTINDTYGHLTGDEVLREAASRLMEMMRPYDFAGRYGGEEFLVVLPSCSPHNGLRRAEEFRRVIADKLVPTAIGPLSITCSLGVAAYDSGMRPEELIHQADEALYRAKRLGRNCVCPGEQNGQVAERTRRA